MSTRQVILIHAHKDIDQLNTLVDALVDERFLIYVNIDAKSALDPLALHPAARLVRKRIPIHWGDFSQVQATLNSLAEIVAGAADFDKVVFISAQDFPLLPNGQLLAELDRLSGHELLDAVQVGPQAGAWDCAERFEYPHRPAGGALASRLCAAAARAMRLARWRRRMPRGWQPYGGSSWWALSRPCIAEILELCRSDAALARFFRSVACPDELFFQTVVMNSRFRSRVLPDTFRYIAWPAQPGARNPSILGVADFESIRASGAHFCRKLDAAASAGLLALLVRHRQQQGDGPG